MNELCNEHHRPEQRSENKNKKPEHSINIEKGGNIIILGGSQRIYMTGRDDDDPDEEGDAT